MNAVKSVAVTLVRAFLIAVLGQLVAVGTGVFTLDAKAWQAIAAAGVAAVIVAAYRALAPTDPSYGRGAPRKAPSGPVDGSDFDAGMTGQVPGADAS